MSRTSTPEYRAWKNARTRCTNPKCENYKRYGARGIKFLFSSFEEFISEIGPRPSPLHSLDRINTYGNYEKGNIRWATREQQAHNKRPFVWPNSLKTHCPKGHPYDVENTILRPHGWRGWVVVQFEI